MRPFRGGAAGWAIAGGAAAGWVFCYLISGSVFSATVLLAVFAALGAVVVLGLRSMGVTRDHPRMRQLASRPWRDGQDVFQAAMSHLHDLFVLAPSGAVYAPTSVEIQMNPEDLESLCERMEFGVVIASATEAYEEQTARYGARFLAAQRPEVYVAGDEGVPQGRYRLRRGDPATAAAQREMADDGYCISPEPEFACVTPPYASVRARSGGWGRREPEPPVTAADTRRVADAGTATVLEKTFTPVPVLRLVTGDSVAQTHVTGARAGRGSVELVLPNVPTISREHARFTFAEGRWRVTNLGVNGLAVNGVRAETEHPLSDGDTILWGSRRDALVSRVEIG